MTTRSTTVVALATAAFLAAGLAGADEPGAAAGSCDPAGFGGSWRNVAVAEGSDVVAAEIRIDCRRAAGATGPKAEIALKVRCLRYECAWRPVPATWDLRRAEGATLGAAFDEERVERQILVEPGDAGRIRLTVTTRYRTVPLEPRRVTYTLQRAD